MKARFIGGLGALIIGLLLCAMGLGLWLSPIKYRATAIIQIEPEAIPDAPEIESSPDGVSYDPYFLQTEIKIIESDKVLSNVVRTLKLDEAWGKRYSNGGTMDMDQAMDLLRRRMELEVPPNTKLVKISVWDEDPALAARMANGTFDAYSHYRIEQHGQLMAGGIEVLKNKYREEAVAITNQEMQLEWLRKQASVTNAEPMNDLQKGAYADYSEEKKSLKLQEDFHTLLKDKIEATENDAKDPHLNLATMVGPADASKVILSQNHSLGANCIIFGLVMSGFGCHLIRRSRRGTGTRV